MIVVHEGAVTHLHLTFREAAELSSAITIARPCGSATTSGGTIAVHVHAVPAPPAEAHKSVGSL